jgi:hypothetical protein
MRKENKRIVFFGVIVFLISIFYFNFTSDIIQIETIEAKFIYSESGSGFDVAEGKLTFGMFSDGGSASRGVTVENTFNESVFVSIQSEGNISEHLVVSNNNFFLEPGESRDLTFSVYAPNNNLYGDYVGTVTIFLKD